MAVGLFVAFWGVSVLFVVTPGADWAYAIAAGLRHRTAAPAITGLLAGHLLATVAVAAGVAAVVAGSPAVLFVLTVAGSLYLVWLGIGTLRQPTTPVAAAAEPVTGSSLRQFGRGLGVSGLNPKVFLLFLALLPQFTDPDGTWPLPVQLVALGLVHVASCAVVYTVVAVGARRVLGARPVASRLVTRVSGALMVLIGVGLLLEQLWRL